MNKAKMVLNATGVIGMILVAIGLSLLMVEEYYITGVLLNFLGMYLCAHPIFGPLDWYLIYKLYLKLRRW